MLDILIEFEITRFMTMEELTNYQVKMTVLVSNLNTLTKNEKNDGFSFEFKYTDTDTFERSIEITKHLIYTYT